VPPGDRAEIDGWTATTLGLPALDRSSVGRRLAEIADLQPPTRVETEELLVEVLLNALSQIPPVPAAWSWGEFHNAGLQPLYDMTREKDWPRWAACAVDLGLGDEPAVTESGEVLSPRAALSRNLTAATERLLHRVRVLLEQAGVATHGHKGFPPPP
jgi:hypothetical protein